MSTLTKDIPKLELADKSTNSITTVDIIQQETLNHLSVQIPSISVFQENIPNVSKQNLQNSHNLTPTGIMSFKFEAKYDKYLKLFVWIPIGISLFFIVIVFDNINKNLDLIIAFILSIVKLFWFSFFIYSLLTAKSLRYFRILECKFYQFANISIPYGVKEHPTKPVKSISHLLQLRGEKYIILFNFFNHLI